MTTPAFPDVDPVGPGPGPGLDGHPAVLAARQLARDLLGPGAAAADAEGVRRGTLDALGAAGLMGLAAPADAGGSDASPAVTREVIETLMVDGSTWFCWAQHQSPVRALRSAAAGPDTPAVEDLRRDLLPALAAGSAVSAIAFAHVRRPGPPGLRAERVPGGWELSGTLDWVTSWDVADLVLVSAQVVTDSSANPGGRGEPAAADLLVHGFLDARSRPGLTVGEPLALLAMGGTHTRPLGLDRVSLPDDRVVEVGSRTEWLARDAGRAADASPSSFGLTRVVVAELAAHAARRPGGSAAALAEQLATECRRVRDRAYQLADEASATGAEHRVEERRATRARALELAQRSAAALITAQAGAAMLAGRPAGRWAREALFLLVQAQTADTREASMRRWLDLTTADDLG